MKDMIEQELLPQVAEIKRVRGWRRYEHGKDSEVEWLGEIPTHWEVKRAIHILQEVRTSIEPISLQNTTVFHYSIPIIETTGDGQLEDGNDTDSSKLVLRGGELLVSKLNPRKNRVLIAEYHEELTICSSEFVVLQPINCDVRYALYFYSSENVRQTLISQVDSATRSHQRVSVSAIAKLLVCIPPLVEQKAIAAFLDRETAKLNALIAKRERMIELLQERRVAVINQAVTKGLNPDVKMKDSGVEWLGMIPEHWEVRRIKHSIHSIVQGWSPSCENRLADIDEWGVLKAGCVNGIAFNELEHKTLPKETEPIPELEIKAGDILMSRANTRELLGSASIVRDVRPKLLLCDKLYRLKIDQKVVVSDFFVLMMRSISVRYQMERDATGASSSMQNISQFTILNLILPVPPLSEQECIVSYLHKETSKIDKLITGIQQSIQKLKEYNTALISAAVTGKIDVRGEVDAVDAESAESVAG